jgi:quercetin dioxygenase-like cupin family protein
MRARLASSLILFLAVASIARAEIPVEDLGLADSGATKPGTVTLRPILAGEIADVETHVLTAVGPARHVEEPSRGHHIVWLVLSGAANLRVGKKRHPVEGETIAWPPLGASVRIDVPAGAVLQALRVRTRLGTEDGAPAKREAFVKAFRDCPTYRDAIKSAKTVSRTLLPKDEMIPGVAMGTVETEGPDEVGAHRHPALDQLFLGLQGNEITVTADDAQATLEAFALLHIPLGSSHGAQVAAGRKLRYLWMDFAVPKQANSR